MGYCENLTGKVVVLLYRYLEVAVLWVRDADLNRIVDSNIEQPKAGSSAPRYRMPAHGILWRSQRQAYCIVVPTPRRSSSVSSECRPQSYCRLKHRTSKSWKCRTSLPKACAWDNVKTSRARLLYCCIGTSR